MRFVYEHVDGRRVSAEEEEFSSAEHNPFNALRTVLDRDGRMLEMVPARTGRAAVSLEQEGFYPAAELDPETGAELPLEEGG